MSRDVNFACRINPAAQSRSLGVNVCANCCRMVDSVPKWQLSLYNTVRPSDDCRSDKGQNLAEECNCPPALGSNGPGVGGWAMVSGNPQVEGFIGIASPILLLVCWTGTLKEKVLLLLQTQPERTYNSHYGNGVLAMFTF